MASTRQPFDDDFVRHLGALGAKNSAPLWRMRRGSWVRGENSPYEIVKPAGCGCCSAS
jgi:hypothetical protein